jgi:hypothetical protein
MFSQVEPMVSRRWVDDVCPISGLLGWKRDHSFGRSLSAAFSAIWVTCSSLAERIQALAGRVAAVIMANLPDAQKHSFMIIFVGMMAWGVTTGARCS